MTTTTAATTLVAAMFGTSNPVTFDTELTLPQWTLASPGGLRVDQLNIVIETSQYHLTREEHRAVLTALWSSVEPDDFVGM